MPPNPLAGLASLGITTAEELQGLVTLFSHKQRDPQPELYQTALSDEDEEKFRLWLIHEGVPFDPVQRNPDYDMRGYWDATVKHGINERDAQTGHFPDTWKTPFHRSFSNESIYAPQDAPHWQGNKLINKYGEVVYNEDDPEDLLPQVADKLIHKDAASGLATGKRNAGTNY